MKTSYSIIDKSYPKYNLSQISSKDSEIYYMVLLNMNFLSLHFHNFPNMNHVSYYISKHDQHRKPCLLTDEF